MNPRASFAAFKEIVSGESEPWKACEVEGINAVKLLLQDTIQVFRKGETTARILVTLNQMRMRNVGELTQVRPAGKRLS